MTRDRRKQRKDPPDGAWIQHPLYGRVPRVRQTTVVGGKTYTWWKCDPGFKPKLPRGAVEGDVARQVFCTCHTPKYFYVDEPRRCIQCGDSFTFSGTEQKYWYETRQFNFHSVPIRCVRCRRLRRNEHALREQVGAARRGVEAHPQDPAAHLALAEAIVELYERTGAGQIEHAIGAARKAAKLARGSTKAADLEARAQAARRSGR